jgi:hypothetical protein
MMNTHKITASSASRTVVVDLENEKVSKPMVTAFRTMRARIAF